MKFSSQVWNNVVNPTKIVFSLVILLTTLATMIYFYVHTYPKYSTYYQYSSQEKKTLSSLNSIYLMSDSGLKKWDSIMFDLVKSNKLGDAHASKVYAYLYTAQRDAAFLSFNVKHDFMGSLDSVSAKTLCLFFSKDCPLILAQSRSDPYSEKLAEIVQIHSETRLREELHQEKLSPEKIGENYWQGVRPYFGQEVASWQPWIIKDPKFFLPSPPPPGDSNVWKEELRLTETELKNITPSQIKAVVFWAGNPSTITPPGMWLKFANDYMETNSIPFSKTLLVRSILAMGIADGAICTFNAKYIYWIKRPFMLSHNLQTIMPTPNHPSYPAGHSVLSATAASILSYYFPENRVSWWQKAMEASQSRSWGGIHFTLDGQAGLLLGKKIGNTITRVYSTQNVE